MTKRKLAYIDPLDIYAGVESNFYPVTLEKAYRHPNGLALAKFTLTWDGKKHTIGIKRNARAFGWDGTSWLTGSYEREQRYWFNSFASTMLTRMIRTLHRPTLFHRAQDYALDKVLYHHLAGFSPSWLGGGRSGGGLSVEQKGNHITVTTDDASEAFTINHITHSITSQLEQPQQLKLFA